jgi:hypothetical protein
MKRLLGFDEEKKRDAFDPRTFRFDEYHEEAQRFFYKRRGLPRREDLDVKAVFYYPNTRDTSLLFLPEFYFPPQKRHKYWAVVSFVGALDSATLRGYLPIQHVWRHADGDFHAGTLRAVTDASTQRAILQGGGKDEKIYILPPGTQIGPQPADTTWCRTVVISSKFLMQRLRPPGDGTAIANSGTAAAAAAAAVAAGQGSPVRAATIAMSRSTSHRLFAPGQKIDVKDDGVWYAATIKEVNDEAGLIKVSFDGFAATFDQWMARDSLQLAPAGKFTAKKQSPPGRGGDRDADLLRRPTAQLQSLARKPDVQLLPSVLWAAVRAAARLIWLFRAVRRARLRNGSPRGRARVLKVAAADEFLGGGAEEDDYGGGSDGGAAVDDGAPREWSARLAALARENADLRKQNEDLRRRLQLALEAGSADGSGAAMKEQLRLAEAARELREYESSLRAWQRSMEEMDAETERQMQAVESWANTERASREIARKLNRVDLEMAQRLSYLQSRDRGKRQPRASAGMATRTRPPRLVNQVADTSRRGSALEDNLRDSPHTRQPPPVSPLLKQRSHKSLHAQLRVREDGTSPMTPPSPPPPPPPPPPVKPAPPAAAVAVTPAKQSPSPLSLGSSPSTDAGAAASSSAASPSPSPSPAAPQQRHARSSAARASMDKVRDLEAKVAAIGLMTKQYVEEPDDEEASEAAPKPPASITRTDLGKMLGIDASPERPGAAKRADAAAATADATDKAGKLKPAASSPKNADASAAAVLDPEEAEQARRASEALAKMRATRSKIEERRRSEKDLLHGAESRSRSLLSHARGAAAAERGGEAADAPAEEAEGEDEAEQHAHREDKQGGVDLARFRDADEDADYDEFDHAVPSDNEEVRAATEEDAEAAVQAPKRAAHEEEEENAAEAAEEEEEEQEEAFEEEHAAEAQEEEVEEAHDDEKDGADAVADEEHAGGLGQDDLDELEDDDGDGDAAAASRSAPKAAWAQANSEKQAASDADEKAEARAKPKKANGSEDEDAAAEAEASEEVDMGADESEEAVGTAALVRRSLLADEDRDDLSPQAAQEDDEHAPAQQQGQEQHEQEDEAEAELEDSEGPTQQRAASKSSKQRQELAAFQDKDDDADFGDFDGLGDSQPGSPEEAEPQEQKWAVKAPTPTHGHAQQRGPRLIRAGDPAWGSASSGASLAQPAPIDISLDSPKVSLASRRALSLFHTLTPLLSRAGHHTQSVFFQAALSAAPRVRRGLLRRHLHSAFSVLLRARARARGQRRRRARPHGAEPPWRKSARRGAGR